MEKKEFNFAELSQVELEQVSSLEKIISEMKEENVVLIAYEEKSIDQ